MKDLFGYEKKDIEVKDTLVCIKCKTTQPIDQFYSIDYGKGKAPEIKRTCRTCVRGQMTLVYQLKKENPYPKEDYKCPICDRGIEEIGMYNQRKLQKWVLDHDHDKGTFRGWVCHHCNVGLGAFRDNLTRLKKAVIYMTKHMEKL